MKKFDWVEDLSPDTPIATAVRELGKILVEALTDWPPPVTWSGGEADRRFGPLFEADGPRPGMAVVHEAAKRLAWEFSRDFEAADAYHRNHHLERACPRPSDQLACDFVFLYVTEAYLQLIERTEQRVRRSDVLAGLDDFAARLRVAWVG